MTPEACKQRYIDASRDLQDAVRRNEVPKILDSLSKVQTEIDKIREDRRNSEDSASYEKLFIEDENIQKLDVNPFDILEELDLCMFSFVKGGKSNVLLVMVAIGVSHFKAVNEYYAEYDKFDSLGRREAWIEQRSKKDMKDPSRMEWLDKTSKLLRGKSGGHPLVGNIDPEFFVAFVRLTKANEVA